MNYPLVGLDATIRSASGSNIAVGIAVGLVIIVVIVVVDRYYPFLPISPIGGGPSGAARRGITFWRTLPAADAENMIVPVISSPTTQADTYTVSAQFVIGDSRTPGLGMYRHILHRGSNPLGITAAQPGPTGHSGIKEAPEGTEITYTKQGLPAVMNPGVFLDRYKNDLQIFVHTVGRQDGNQVLWLESLTVSDLPLNTPLTLGIISNGQTLEVYLNCRLYSTMLLKGKPYLPKNDNAWYGRYGLYPFQGLIKNLQLWPTALSTSDYVAMCGSPNFDMGDVPQPGCAKK